MKTKQQGRRSHGKLIKKAHFLGIDTKVPYGTEGKHRCMSSKEMRHKIKEVTKGVGFFEYLKKKGQLKDWYKKYERIPLKAA